MDGPYASQPQEVPQLFQDETSPRRIFVSANGINGRPKLVRTLKKAGAIICSDPKQANVILVDPTSDAGREFIREWGSDTDKVVLQHTWVAACIAASKVLGKDDGWGGFLTFDDGLPIAKEDTDPAEDTIKSPLPTPRITPVEVPSSTSNQSAPTTAPDLSFGSQSSLQDTVPNGSLNSYPLNSPFANQQMYQQAFMMHPAFIAQMQQQAFGQPNAMPVFQHPTGPNGPLTPYSSGMNPFSFDISNMNVNPPYGTFNRNMFPQDPFNNSSSPNPTDFNSSTVPPSFRRKSPILSRSTPASYTSGEQMRSISPTSTLASRPSQSISQRAPSRGSSLSGALFRTKNGLELSFFVQVDLSNRSRTVTAIKKNGGKIVSSNKTADYAILYSQSKTFLQLLESTTLAGRPAVSAAFVHDCVDRNKLLNTSLYEFETPPPKSTTPRGKRKRVKSEEEEEDSLNDSIIVKRLEMDHSPEDGMDPASSSDEASGFTKAETDKPASPERQNVHRLPVQSDDPSLPRSPTPPPDHTRKKRGNSDGYMYSEQERDYAKRYIKVLLRRDHQISNSAIGKALYDKMDNHSIGSWRTFLTQEPFKSVVDSLRKTAGIEFRKQQARVELLAKEVEIVAQFFATGAGRSNPDEEDDGNDAVAWERLTQQTKCQSCASWTDWYSDHHAKVEKRYQELLAST
ncbi:40S ribosomal protein S16 [Termitomyces sp. T112]|nr:40S ribosomal protein S16 [Termitomyces sp. T112]